MRAKNLFFGMALTIMMMSSCGGGSYKKSPLDVLIRDLPSDQPFSIILYDMNVDGNFFKDYYHKYKIIEEQEDETTTERITDWMEVSEEEFQRNLNNMGMEIAARTREGKLSKSAAPPGYHNYVGNQKYGRWRERNGTSFWEFYGQYAFMSSMFNMMSYPARRSYYNDWRGNYYGTGRSYYGPRTSSGQRYYGTNSKFNQSSNKNSAWSRRSSRTSAFRNRVNQRTSRSGSRSSRSSYRSRGGGFGK